MSQCEALSIFNPEHKITSPEQWEALVQATYAFLKSLAKVANVSHTWTPACDGYSTYCRQAVDEAGTMIVSNTHKFTHPFIVSRGSCMIRTQADGVHVATGPVMSVTNAGTQRIILVLEDMVWTTIHTVPNELVGNPEGCRKYLTEE
jgi:hypothetical protein